MITRKNYDEISGEELPAHLVKEARKLEIHYFRQMEVYPKVPWRDATDATGKPPIKVRWVDVNKGSKEMPEVRSRLVAKEIKRSENRNYLQELHRWSR